jgi:hypothetical protein
VSNKVLIFLLLILNISVLEAQYPQTIYNSADSAWYDQLLYNGTEWRPTMQLVDGYEFFLTSEFLYGSVTIEGITFNEVRMRYDICNDDIIILWKNTLPIVIDSKKVDEFALTYNGVLRKFINLRDNSPVIQGFAEVLYKGKSQVVVNYSKTVSKIPTHTHYAEFREDTRYYFIVNGSCFQIRNKSSFLKVMGEYEVPVRKFIRQQKVVVGILSPGGFGIAAAYFDSLTGKKKPD